MNRPVFIGEAPGRTGTVTEPLMGALGKRLSSLAGIDPETFGRSVIRHNVLPTNPGKRGVRGDDFPMAEARNCAKTFRSIYFGEDRLIVLLGKRVAAAFGLKLAYFERTKIEAATVVVIPHPSGVNRWWNDPHHAEQARRFMRALVVERRLRG